MFIILPFHCKYCITIIIKFIIGRNLMYEALGEWPFNLTTGHWSHPHSWIFMTKDRRLHYFPCIHLMIIRCDGIYPDLRGIGPVYVVHDPPRKATFSQFHNLWLQPSKSWTRIKYRILDVHLIVLTFVRKQP